MLLPILYGSLVGLSLGLTGGGGSIFAIPLLVYGLEVDFRRSVAVSLAVVGITALYGAILQVRKKVVLWRAGALLGLGGILAAPFGARLGSILPERISLLLFAALMLFIGFRMLQKGRDVADVPISWMACQRTDYNMPSIQWSCAGRLLVAGFLTGVLAGIFGVGGGFLLVPALLVVASVRIEQAMSTSLVAMFLISTSGFAANYENLKVADLVLATWFLAGAGLGMTVGVFAKGFLPATTLKKGFALMVISTAGFIIAQNL